MTALSADWVLPVDGPPIEGGLVRFEGGAITEVGPGRAERHFDAAAIIPGFVNAHSHLEYAVYAGFGDGEAFGPWITAHVTRKQRLDFDDMVAIARLGAARVAAVRRHDDGRLQLLRRRRGRGAGRPARDRLPRGVRRRPAPPSASSRRSASA